MAIHPSKMTTLNLIGLAMTREATPQQRIDLDKLNRDGGLFRTYEVRSFDEEARTVELAFSSEIEVERWFGTEVLDHEKSSVRLQRLQDGAALLMDHNFRDQVGVVESVSIDEDRRGRAVVRFGRGARAEEIFQDVVDGIRRHVSVGYLIHGYEVTERKGQPDAVRITDWEPYEISLVSVPADPSVGVGRSLDNAPEDEGRASLEDGKRKAKAPGKTDSQRGNKAMEKTLRNAAGDLVRAIVDEQGNITETLEVLERAADRQNERRAGGQEAMARVRAIMEMGEQYGAADLAREAALDESMTVDKFQRKLLDHLNERTGRPLDEQTAGADVGMDGKEVRQYSFLRAIRALADPANRRAQEAAAFEYECSEAAQQRSGKEAQGILVPADVLRSALVAGQRAPMSSGTTGGADSAGHLIENELLTSSFVDLLRNRNTIMRLGRVLGGLTGNLDIPRQIAGATGYWLGEDDDAGEGNQELDQVGMTPKTVGAFSEITRKTLMQSSMDVEALVRSDLASALAGTIDLAGFYGSGSANQPLGIVNHNGINALDFAADNPAYNEVVGLETEIAADNADVNSMAYVLNARMRGHFKTSQKFDGTNGNPVWEQGNTLNGYRAEVTNQVENGDLIFGNFADLLVGLWGGLDLTVDPYSNSKKGRLRVVTFQDVDFVLRRLESFALGRKPAA